MLAPKRWNPDLAADATVRAPGGREYPADLLFYFDGDLRPSRPVNDWVAYDSVRLALKTINTYSREVARFANFLDVEYDIDFLGAEVREDGDRYLRAYNAFLVQAEKSSDSLKPRGASKTVIDKVRAALLSFYWFCVEDGALDTFPFSLVRRRTRHGEVETLRYMHGGRITQSYRDPIPSSQLRAFYEVGLLGRLPDGSPDPTFGSYESAQRNAAGFGLGVGLGLRHHEILGTTIFEVPVVHEDGLTPGRVAHGIAKRKHGRKVAGLSEWLLPVHRYITGDRRQIARRATWMPGRAWVIDPSRTTRTQVLVTTPSGREETLQWNDLDREHRLKLAMPGGGSPMVLLDHSKKNGAPLTDEDSLNAALALAGNRCQRYWPALEWAFSAHHLRHTFATELTMFLADSARLATQFEEAHGRPPAWARVLDRQDKNRIVQDSMGHRDITTTNRYREAAFWSLLMATMADPEHNPAVREAAL